MCFVVGGCAKFCLYNFGLFLFRIDDRYKTQILYDMILFGRCEIRPRHHPRRRSTTTVLGGEFGRMHTQQLMFSIVVEGQ